MTDIPFKRAGSRMFARALLPCILLAGCSVLGPARPPEGPTVAINLVALNDFHGNLEPSKYTYTPARSRASRTVQAGGIAVLGGALDAFRKEDPNLLFVGAGDLVGASPALSSLWADEPSLEALSRMGLVASAPGNHEFDAGGAELLRQQRGGCVSPRPAKACKLAPNFGGAGFSYLAANVIDRQTGQPVFPGWRIVDVKGVKVGLIGAALQSTPKLTIASATTGLDFLDEATAINAQLPAMRAQGAQVFVVLIHQGGMAREAFDQPDCNTLAGPIVDIVKRLDPAIRLVVSGHSHTGYLCRVGNRVVTQADSAGHLLSRITLNVDPQSGAVRDIAVRNVVMDPAVFAPNPRLASYLDDVRKRSSAVLNRVVARIAAGVPKQQNDAGESQLGDMVADSMLAAAQDKGAQVALMNAGGIRRDLETGPAGAVNFGQAQAVLPFGNQLVVMDLTGAQLVAALERQWQRPADAEPVVLQVSQGLSYRWDARRSPGTRVVPGSVMLNGAPVAPDQVYRIVTNTFLAGGGSDFGMFKEGARRVDLATTDLDAFIVWLHDHPWAGGRALGGGPARIQRVH